MDPNQKLIIFPHGLLDMSFLIMRVFVGWSIFEILPGCLNFNEYSLTHILQSNPNFMKKIILILTIILSFQVIAQKKNIIPVSNVPNGIVKKFKVDYPKANSIIWHKTEKGNYKAKFKRPNSKVTVTYKADGTWKSTKIVKSKEAIPSKVRAEVKQHFPAYKLNKFIIIKKKGRQPTA